MRLTRRALPIFWSYHAWAGVTVGLLVYVMVLTGTITLFRHPLELWSEPLHQQTASTSSKKFQTALDLAIARIGNTPEELWVVVPQGDHGATTVSYELPDGRTWRQVLVDHERATAVIEREALATFLYHLHFLWHPAAPWLYYVAGFAAVALLFAIVTGVLIHLRSLMQQLHRFRPHARLRVVWSDLHKVLGVVGLPFQTFYAYSGAFLVLGAPLATTLTSAFLGVDTERARQWTGDEIEVAGEPPGTPSTVLTLDDLVTVARYEEPRLVVRSLSIRHHGRDNGSVEIDGSIEGGTTAISLRLRELDGAVTANSTGRPENASQQYGRWLTRLHFADLGGTGMRILYAVLGLATSLTILSGNWIWMARRESRNTSILARLTAGFGAGIVVAIAALFLGSRLLPLDTFRRMTAEELTFALALTACLAWSLAARDVPALWWKMSALAGAMLLLTPLFAARLSTAGLFGRPGARVGPVVGVDVTLLGSGMLLCIVAWALRRRTTSPVVTGPSKASTRDPDVLETPFSAATRRGGDA